MGPYGPSRLRWWRGESSNSVQWHNGPSRQWDNTVPPDCGGRGEIGGEGLLAAELWTVPTIQRIASCTSCACLAGDERVVWQSYGLYRRYYVSPVVLPVLALEAGRVGWQSYGLYRRYYVSPVVLRVLAVDRISYVIRFQKRGSELAAECLLPIRISHCVAKIPTSCIL